MKLSEAMLKGAKVVKQIKGSFMHVQDGEKCACALGAAILAVKPDMLDSDQPNGSYMKILDDNWSYDRIMSVRVKHPVKEGVEYPLEILVMELNDEHNWPIEKIANYLQEQGF